MESKSHSEYEQTFSRIATILERLAEAVQQQANCDIETRRMLEDFIAQYREREAETTDKLNGLIELVDSHLREHRGEK